MSCRAASDPCSFPLPVPSREERRSSFVLLTDSGPRWVFDRRSIFRPMVSILMKGEPVKLSQWMNKPTDQEAGIVCSYFQRLERAIWEIPEWNGMECAYYRKHSESCI